MFYDFHTFISYLVSLWPLNVLLLCLLFIFVKYVFMLIKSTVERIGRERELELQKIVAANSEWYQKVQELNNQTKFYKNVIDNGHSIYCVSANSKAKFDRTFPEEVFWEFLSLHREKAERALEQVYRNRVINEVYMKKYNALCSVVSQEQSEEVGLRFDKFLEIEKKIVRESKLHIVQEYSVTCYVRYSSPQGRNQYSKHLNFDESRIRVGLKELERKNAFHTSEEWRRKNERSKITPAIRYDVMKRDGFKCCLCGRSARNGTELEVDHIVPISRGGNSSIGNLQTLCRDCNRGKGAKI